jgi:hypothetical protein
MKLISHEGAVLRRGKAIAFELCSTDSPFDEFRPALGDCPYINPVLPDLLAYGS